VNLYFVTPAAIRRALGNDVQAVIMKGKIVKNWIQFRN